MKETERLIKKIKDIESTNKLLGNIIKELIKKLPKETESKDLMSCKVNGTYFYVLRFMYRQV